MLGSSPLARGTRVLGVLLGCAVGLIPARAGNTGFLYVPRALPRAHPRSRGEHLENDAMPTGEQGSSPLARGTPLMLIVQQAVTGLIPARAGNTSR